jgi:hypothetical protein
MPNLKLLVVSESVSIDASTNQLSIFSVLEQISGPAAPFVVPALVVTAVWDPDAGDELRDWQMTTRVRTALGTQHEIPTNFRFGPGRRHRVMQRAMGLPIDAAGAVTFEVLLNGELRGTYVIQALLEEAAAGEPH